MSAGKDIKTEKATERETPKVEYVKYAKKSRIRETKFAALQRRIQLECVATSKSVMVIT